jgi:hypothetical protein
MVVPWKQIITWAPQILSLSRDLLNKSRAPSTAETLLRSADSDNVPARVTALEENERRQAELVDKMAAQQAELSKAIVNLHKRQTALIIAVVVLTLALVYVRWAS